MNNLTVSKLTISGTLAENMESKIFILKKSYLFNLTKILDSLENNDISVYEIHAIAKDTAHKLYPLIRMLFNLDNSNRIKIFRQIMIIVSKERLGINSKLNIDPERRDLDTLISMYFSTVVFMYSIEYSKYMTFHPITLTALFFAPILEEVGKFVDSNFFINNFYLGFRSNLKMLFLDLYIGWYKYRIMNLEPSIKILYKTYMKLLNKENILSIAKVDQFLQDSGFIQNTIFIFISILLSGFIPETLEQIFKLGNIFEKLYTERI